MCFYLYISYEDALNDTVSARPVCLVQSSSTLMCSLSNHQSHARIRYLSLPLLNVVLLWPFYTLVPWKIITLGYTGKNKIKIKHASHLGFNVTLKELLLVTRGTGKCLSCFTRGWTARVWLTAVCWETAQARAKIVSSAANRDDRHTSLLNTPLWFARMSVCIADTRVCEWCRVMHLFVYLWLLVSAV